MFRRFQPEKHIAFDSVAWTHDARARKTISTQKRCACSCTHRSRVEFVDFGPLPDVHQDVEWLRGFCAPIWFRPHDISIVGLSALPSRADLGVIADEWHLE